MTSTRSPFASVVARPARRAAGRTPAPETPVVIRAADVSMTPALRDHIRQRVGWRLGKFALRIERVTVRFEDVNGPRGGRDLVCRIKVVISGLQSVVVTEVAHDAREAFDRADGRVEQAVRRAIRRGRDRGVLDRVPARAGAPGPTEDASRGSARAAPRNFTRRPRKATFALESSARSRPSRKSTRSSANRAKHGNKLARREQRRLASPTRKRAQPNRKR